MSQLAISKTIDKKTLYLHTGTHKTGSTALQAYLTSNIKRLDNFDVSYTFMPGADQSIGNGHFLYKALHGRCLPEQDLDELLSSYFAGKTASILSSEDFTCFGKSEWLQVKNACQRLGINVKTITCIRNIAQYYSSLYRQLVKGGDIYASAEIFYSQNQYYPIVDSLRNIMETFGKEAMSLIHYETFSDKLDFAFTAVLGLSYELFDRSSILRPVNRSLTEYELKILKLLNKATGNQYSYELSNLLTCKNPYLDSLIEIDENTIEMLDMRHFEDVNWVNLTFFDGIDTLKICERTDSIFPNLELTQLTPEMQQSIDRCVTEWAIQKLESVQGEVRQRLVSRLIGSVSNITISDPDLPDDFNLIAYLLLNSDVLFADIDPCVHYKSSGRQEGRSYQFEGSYIINQTSAKEGVGKKQLQQIISSFALLNNQMQVFLDSSRSQYAELQLSDQNLQDYVKQQKDLTKSLYLPFALNEYKDARTDTTLVVVLGMHRSGTSVITRSLQVFGVELGEQLMQALPDNPKGFWEDLDINQLNMDMLEALGANWDTLGPISNDKFAYLLNSDYFRQATSLLCKKTETANLWGVKDPRIAKLLPFWKVVFAYCGFKVHYIIALRDPLSVCKSLRKRDNFDCRKSYALWIGHLISSLLGTIGESWLIVNYDQLMDAPEQQLLEISNQFNLPIIPEQKAGFIQEFLEESLRHSVSNQDDLLTDPCVLPLALEMYTSLRQMGSNGTYGNDEFTVSLVHKWRVEFERQNQLLSFLDEVEQKNIYTNAQYENKIQQIVSEKERELHQYQQESLKRQQVLESEIIQTKLIAQYEVDALQQQMNAVVERQAEHELELQRKIEEQFIHLSELKDVLANEQLSHAKDQEEANLKIAAISAELAWIKSRWFVKMFMPQTTEIKN